MNNQQYTYWETIAQQSAKLPGLRYTYALIALYELTKASGDTFDFTKFIELSQADALELAGIHFYEERPLEISKKLFNLSWQKRPRFQALLHLLELSREDEESTLFKDFLARAESSELMYAGHYFYHQEDWVKSKQVYEKLYKESDSPMIRTRLEQIREQGRK